jgi:hypothetical protein
MSLRRLIGATGLVVLLLCVGIAVAAAPGVLYSEPTDVTTVGVVLNASINPGDKQTTYHFEYGPTTAYGAATSNATLAKSKAWKDVSAQLAGLQPGTTYHYRLVAWNGGGSKDKTIGADRSFTTGSPPPDPSDPPPNGSDPPSDPGDPTNPDPPAGGPAVHTDDSVQPKLGSSVVVQPGKGAVMVRRPGSHGFVPLEAGAELPLGTQVDVHRGSISLTSALPSGKTQLGRFGGGRFQVEQSKRGYVDLYLRGRACNATKRRGASATAAASARPRSRRRLWGRDHGGRFRTHGRNSHATVRGTRWFVEDRCDGTLTRVASGTVIVRDTVRHRRITLHAGQHYLARSRHRRS